MYVAFPTADPLLSRPVWGAWIEIPLSLAFPLLSWGRAPYGARGLKYVFAPGSPSLYGGRAPYGARGLKSLGVVLSAILSMSRPVWGAWIEMLWLFGGRITAYSRAPYGARGLKWPALGYHWRDCPVAPRMGRVD